ncbi:MAG: glycine cleavage system aminomethyltransferase GcvT [Bacteroidota bacterium]|nr:glycine cleavage system aminomethyltransferase GcvT [Candidatus Kapabacteria bacterium]MDW8219442.1 glycine cleavage system aminomethyltransferase GcvT [Bacteroidota bacterium]
MHDTPLRQTALYKAHLALGAKMVAFAGFAMPVQYTRGILHEHHAVRRSVGIFDVSHMGEVEISGNRAEDFVQKLTTNDVKRLVAGKAQYSAMCYADGGIVDDIIVYHRGEYYLLVINAANIAQDIAWMKEIREHYGMNYDVSIRDVSNEVSLLAVQGPRSLDTLQKLTQAKLENVAYYTCIDTVLADVPLLVSRTGYTGELGFELYIRGGEPTVRTVWDAILDAGAEFGIEPCGLGARDTLRLEKGYCLYGNDIDRTTNPLEAGLGWITKLSKDEFMGKSALVEAQKRGLQRKLVGFKLRQEKVIPRKGYTLHKDGQNVGIVTSGSISPSLNIGIGMGYVQIDYAQIGTVIELSVRSQYIPVEIVRMPFV